MSHGRLQGKVALITGGASGIGMACAELFANEGADVVLADRNLEGAQRGVGQLVAIGQRAVATPLEVTDETSCRAAVDAAMAEFGRIDVLLNSAGVGARGGTDGTTYEERWSNVVDINLKGSVLMARAVSEQMKVQGSGSVINIASIRGLVGYPAFITDGFNPYPHSKGGVVNFTRDMAIGMAQSGIRVNALCPGFTRTEMTRRVSENPDLYNGIVNLIPLGRFAEAQEIANAALFLASDESSFVTGACLVIDGGFTAQ